MNAAMNIAVKRVLLLLAALLAVLVAVLLLAALRFDPATYRPLLAERLALATGREVAIDGDLTLGWLPLELRLGGLRLGHPPGFAVPATETGAGTHMLMVEAVSVRPALWPLLRGQLRLRQVTIDGVALALLRDGDGVGNWLFEGAEPAEPGQARALPELEELRVRDLRLSFHDVASGRDESWHLTSMDLEPGPEAAGMAFSFRSEYRGATLAGQGQIGSLAGLAGSAPWPLDLRLDWQAAELAVAGTLQPPALTAVDLRLAGEASSLAGLLAPFDLELPALPATLSTRVVGDADRYQAEALRATLGGSDVRGRVVWQPEASAFAAELQSEQVQLHPWRRGASTPVAPDAPLFSAHPWPHPLLPALAVELSWRIGALTMGAATVLDVNLDASLDGGGQLSGRLAGRLGDGGAVQGELSLSDHAEGLQALLEVSATELALGPLLLQTGRTRDIDVDVDVQLRASTRGESLAGMMAGLDGHLSLAGGQGRIHNRALGALSSDLLGSLAPFLEQRDSAVLNCMAARLDFASGVAEEAMLLFDTETLTLAGGGRVDLAGEQLALLLTPRPKRAGLMNLATPVEWSGPLRAPEWRLESAGVARRSAGLALAVVNPLVLLVPVVTTTLGGDHNPCEAALQQARTGTRAETPESRVEGLRRGLRRLFGGDGEPE